MSPVTGEPQEPQPPPEVLQLRAAYDRAAATINARPPEEAFEVAAAVLVEARRLADAAAGLRDVQVARVYDTRSMTLVELAKVLRWGASGDGAVTRGRMGQVVSRGRTLRDQITTTEDQPDDTPAA